MQVIKNEKLVIKLAATLVDILMTLVCRAVTD